MFESLDFFGYYAAGSHFQFVVIGHDGERVIIQDMGRKLVLSRLTDCLGACASS